MLFRSIAMKPLKKNATYDDLREVPEHFVAEMFDGELYAIPRPGLPHARATTVLGAKLGDLFDWGSSGPGGWVILYEPELHLGNDVLVPDIAGWRRERLPAVPADPHLALAPDWVCEVLSPSTEALDRGKKLARYARAGVAHAWLLNPVGRSLEVLALENGKWALLDRHEGRSSIRARPFDEVELELRALWI